MTLLVRQIDLSVICDRCGASTRVELPCPLDVWLAAAEAFRRLHAPCEQERPKATEA